MTPELCQNSNWSRRYAKLEFESYGNHNFNFNFNFNVLVKYIELKPIMFYIALWYPDSESDELYDFWGIFPTQNVQKLKNVKKYFLGQNILLGLKINILEINTCRHTTGFVVLSHKCSFSKTVYQSALLLLLGSTSIYRKLSRPQQYNQPTTW